MRYGLDFLGLAKYAKVAAENFPAGWALGTFSSTFGDARPAVERILKTGKPSAVRVHLAWADDHNFALKDGPKIVREAQGWLPLVERYPNVVWYFSGACEHKLSAKFANDLAMRVLDVFPETTWYVNAPMKGGADIIGPRILNERHGTKARRKFENDAFSFDGSACVDADVEFFKKEFVSHNFFFWEPRFNGRYEADDNTPRPERDDYPDKKLIESVVALSKNKGLVRALPKGWIYKSHSENDGKPSLRAEKPCLISPLKKDKITLRLANRKVIATFNYYGTYKGGGHRYYTEKWGYEIAQMAEYAQGSPIVQIWAGTMIGVINPAFRTAPYR